MSEDRSPALLASIVAVLVLSVVGWFFLRAIESDEASGNAADVASAESQSIRSNIIGSVASVDAVAAALSRSGLAELSDLGSLAARSDLTSASRHGQRYHHANGYPPHRPKTPRSP